MNDDSEQDAGRHPKLRGIGLFLVTGALCWLTYVWLGSTIAANRVRALATSSGVSVQHVQARTWFPGHLVLRDLVVSHAWRGNPCRTSAARVALPHDPLKVVQGTLRIGTLTAESVAISCRPSGTRPAQVPTTKASLGTLMPLTSLATLGTQILSSIKDDSPSQDSVVVQRAVIEIDGVSFAQMAMMTPFEARVKDLSVTGGRLRFALAELSLESGAVSWNAPQIPSAVQGVLRLDLAWQDGQVAPGSSASLSLEPFTWRHEGGARTQLEATSLWRAELLQRVETRPEVVEWQVSVPAFRHQDDQGLTAEAHDLQLRVSSKGRHPLPLGHPANFDLQATAVVVARNHLALTADSASFEGQLAGPSHASLLDTVHASLRDARLRDDDASEEPLSVGSTEPGDPFSATARLTTLTSGAGYAGSLHAAGDDAGVVLTLIQGRELPEWIESKFHGEPFELDAALAVKDGAVRLSNLVLERGALQLQGFWQLASETQGGALLLQYGGLSVGIDGSEGGRVVLRPGPGWLQEKSLSLASPSGGG